ncbi:unnamed protein product, partial [Gordionus sp. m RMFG-2023]
GMSGRHRCIYWENLTVRISIYREYVNEDGRPISPLNYRSIIDHSPPIRRNSRSPPVQRGVSGIITNNLDHSELPEPRHLSMRSRRRRSCYLCGSPSHLRMRCPRGPNRRQDLNDNRETTSHRSRSPGRSDARPVRTILPPLTIGAMPQQDPSITAMGRPVGIIEPFREETPEASPRAYYAEEWPMVDLSASEIQELLEDVMGPE